METPMEATPRPWFADTWLEPDIRTAYVYEQTEDGRMPIGEFDTIEQAERCVRAVNAHDDLVAALDEAIVLIEFFHGRAGWSEYQQSPEMKRIRAALKKAGK